MLTQYIKSEAARLGFNACGIARAEAVDERSRTALQEWLDKGKQGEMEYLTHYTDKRLDPRLLFEGAKSIVCVALNYYPRVPLQKYQYQFAWYAYGKDYHEVVKNRLNLLLSHIREQDGRVNGRAFCDTAPMLERYWACRAGLGWIGKNTLLIIPQAGSTFFLGELILDVELEYDTPQRDRCGSCTRCLDACPTHALESPYHLNAGRCLSYLTIEHKGEIPDEAADKIGNCIYGCDRCQQACPWNRFAHSTQDPDLTPTDDFLQMTPEEWNHLSVERYRELFKGSAVKRAKYEGLMRNIREVKKVK